MLMDLGRFSSISMLLPKNKGVDFLFVPFQASPSHLFFQQNKLFITRSIFSLVIISFKNKFWKTKTFNSAKNKKQAAQFFL